jgi:hypothetical protein
MGLPSSRYARLEQAHTGDLQKRRYTNLICQLLKRSGDEERTTRAQFLHYGA